MIEPDWTALRLALLGLVGMIGGLLLTLIVMQP